VALNIVCEPGPEGGSKSKRRPADGRANASRRGPWEWWKPTPQREMLPYQPRPRGSRSFEAFCQATWPERANAPRIVRLKRTSKGADAHLRYLQRDGTTREGEPGRLYGPQTDAADGREFVERGREDRHQFRFIVAPEDGDQLTNLRASPAMS
jgi:hypothetical protein